MKVVSVLVYSKICAFNVSFMSSETGTKFQSNYTPNNLSVFRLNSNSKLFFPTTTITTLL